MEELNLEPRNMSLEEFEDIVVRVRRSHESVADVQRNWAQLHSYFVDQSFEYDKNFLWTFFRLYVDLSWNILDTLPRDVVINVLIPRTVPMACMRGVDVVTRMSWYIGTAEVLENKIIALFFEIKEKLLSSGCIIGNKQVGYQALSELVADSIPVTHGTADSLVSAEFYVHLETLLFPKNEEEVWQYVIAETPDQIVRQFVEVISFFQAGDKNNASYLIDSVIHPIVDVLPRSVTVQSDNDVGDSILFGEKKIGEDNPVAKDSIDTAINVEKDDVRSRQEQVLSTQVPLSETFQSAQSTFGTDLSTIDIPTLLAYLDTQATEQGDERIRDIVRFNEQTGKFEWNTDMLSE